MAGRVALSYSGTVRLWKRSRASDLFDTQLLLATADTGLEAGERVRDEELSVGVRSIRDESGRPVLPAFTSEKALLRWLPEGSRYVVLRGRDVLELFHDGDWDVLALDAGDPHVRLLSRVDAGRLLGVARKTVPEGTSVLIGQPAKAPPNGFLEEIRQACAEAAVIAAYLFQTEVPADDAGPHLAVGIDTADPGDEQAARAAESIAERLRPPDWGYDFVDVLPIEGDLLEAVRASAPPVYVRDRSG